MVSMPTAGHPVSAAITSIMCEAARHGAPFQYTPDCLPRDINRNRVVQSFLDDPTGFEWLVMVDDDQIVPAGAIANLLSVNKPVVIAPTPIMVANRIVMNVSRWNDDPNHTYLWPSKHQWDVTEPPYRCAAGGTGMILIHRSVFEKLEFPWFVENHGGPRGEGQQTEDVIFCNRCVEAGIEIWCHPAVVCGHMKRVNLMDICTGAELKAGHFVKATPSHA